MTGAGPTKNLKKLMPHYKNFWRSYSHCEVFARFDKNVSSATFLLQQKPSQRRQGPGRGSGGRVLLASLHLCLGLGQVCRSRAAHPPAGCPTSPPDRFQPAPQTVSWMPPLRRRGCRRQRLAAPPPPWARIKEDKRNGEI